MTQPPKALAHCLWLGFRAMFKPAYWWLAFWPVALSILAVGLLLWWLLPALLSGAEAQIQAWKHTLAPESGGMPGLGGIEQPRSGFSGPDWLIPALVFLVKILSSPAALSILGWVLGLLAALPLSWLFVLLISGLFVTPVIRADLIRRDYPDLRDHKGGGWIGDMGQTLFIFLRLALGLLLLLPLWFFVPWLASLLFIALMAWSTASIFLIDCLSGLTSLRQREAMMQAERPSFWVLGGLVSAMGSFPLMWLLAPIFASVVFGHFSLSRLNAAGRAGSDPQSHFLPTTRIAR
ncbi:MAG: hypothetical protein EBT36_03135 [Betaproteobacteria bacterium]|nr:EI24 domain-containing protein [Pseudomonadota bacterium]NBP34537.1 hypothetical protein [Betaproteobacteria bacterium]NBQ77112.1 hypothetical protein [Betaproteobacteria bacterium]NBS37787.1 hypothetical protein [Betaproteobacteria bacterium]NBT70404.1 hypothetical protein [Betaproteobacteria bacterium]